MKFVFPEDRPEFDWPVKVKVPRDGGGYQPQEFTARFRMAPRSVINEHLRRQAEALARQSQGLRAMAAAEDAEDAKDPEDAEDAILKEYFVGWGADVVDAAGSPVPFSPGFRDQMLEFAHIRKAVSAAYWQAVNGDAKAKN